MGAVITFQIVATRSLNGSPPSCERPFTNPAFSSRRKRIAETSIETSACLTAMNQSRSPQDRSHERVVEPDGSLQMRSEEQRQESSSEDKAEEEREEGGKIEGWRGFKHKAPSVNERDETVDSEWKMRSRESG